MTPSVTVSAPGKVLLAGGYLVLDRKYSGLVFGLDARIFVRIEPVPTGYGVALSEVVVRSLQFRQAEWRYGYRTMEEGGGIAVKQLQSSPSPARSTNPFVETALGYALTYVSTLTSASIAPSSVTILADDAYYSSSSPPSSSSSVPPSASPSPPHHFTRFDTTLSDAHKTGLGSSAALVTAFVGAVLSHYLTADQFSLATDDGKRRLHNLAQIAHCAAQGKVGSGFDVAAAVYGTCVYQRFSPAVLESLGEIGSSGFVAQLRDLVEDPAPLTRWDMTIRKDALKLPPGVRLILCDVDCGSQTVGMAKKVLAWRAECPEQAEELWYQLNNENGLLHTHLNIVNAQANDQGDLSQAWDRDLDDIARAPTPRGIGARPEEDRLWLGQYVQLQLNILAIRHWLRSMSISTGVPIEPPMQTRLLDICSKIPGVLGGVVPGAGGFDAIVLIAIDRAEVDTNLHEVLNKWNDTQETKVHRLEVKQSTDGVREEQNHQYILT
ncbi:MAG: phosphomevalonate kinase [Thelocarpon superellum]|nr:MAG: phosphomevalonate kinase [Thelocarpon superellum]